MDTSRLKQEDACRWMLPPFGGMRVPAVLFASEQLVREMDEKVLDQLAAWHACQE